MSDSKEESQKTVAPKLNDVKVPPPAPTAPQAADLENQTEPAPMGTNRGTRTGFGVPGILRRWKRDDLMKRSSIILTALAFVFSLLAFIIMASNKHGDWKDFDNYEEYKYLLAIAILSTLYTGFQIFRQIHEASTGKPLLQRRTSLLLDFIGDQIMAYLLISAASSAVPLTNRMRETQDNIFTDSTASALSMAFLAFFTLALSAIISGHKLSNQSSYV